MIELWPAIDIIGGENVRLTEGDYGTTETMKRTPLEAVRFYRQFEQVKRIHLVDLMGAKEKSPREYETFAQLIAAAESMPVEIGGGIRSEATIQAYLELGADYLVIGTRGLQDPDWLRSQAEKRPGRLVLGLDAQGTDIAINGWLESLGVDIFEFVDQIQDVPLGGIIYTDIRKDGRMEGPSFELTGELVKRSVHPVIASGGVRSKDDVDRLEALGVQAAIVGKAANTDSFWAAYQ